jgi:hypothetical protein
MANIAVELFESAVELGRMFTEVALQDPLSAILVATSVLLFAFTVGLGASLLVGAVLSALGGLIPENVGRPPPERGR